MSSSLDRLNEELSVRPGVYVVLVSFRDAPNVCECLRSLQQQTYPHFRIIICNNSPGYDLRGPLLEWSRERASTPSIHFTNSARADELEVPAGIVVVEADRNRGFAGGNNIALRMVRNRSDCQFVWLLNTDTVVSAGALEAMVATAERDPSVGMVGSKLLYYADPNVVQFAAGGAIQPWRGLTTELGNGSPDDGRWDEEMDVGYVTGASLLARMAMISEIGLLDERYFLYSEEVDWCLRARAAGWKLRYSPGSRILHKGGGTVKHGSPLHDYYSLRSMLLLAQKFRPQLLPLTLLYSMYRCLAPKIVRGQIRRLQAIGEAYRDFFSMIRSAETLANPPRPNFHGNDPSHHP